MTRSSGVLRRARQLTRQRHPHGAHVLRRVDRLVAVPPAHSLQPGNTTGARS